MESHNIPYMRKSKLSILPEFCVVRQLKVTSSRTFTESSESCQSRHCPDHKVWAELQHPITRQLRNPVWTQFFRHAFQRDPSFMPFSVLVPVLWIFWDERTFAQYPTQGWTMTLYIQCYAGVFYSFTNNLKLIYFIFNSSYVSMRFLVTLSYPWSFKSIFGKW